MTDGPFPDRYVDGIGTAGQSLETSRLLGGFGPACFENQADALKTGSAASVVGFKRAVPMNPRNGSTDVVTAPTCSASRQNRARSGYEDRWRTGPPTGYLGRLGGANVGGVD